MRQGRPPGKHHGAAYPRRGSLARAPAARRASFAFPGILLLVRLVSVLGLLGGCATGSPNPIGPADCPDAEVVLQPGDVLGVKFPYCPELNEEQAIRPDGKIALQLVGEVEAAQRTPEQLRTELLTLYESKLKNPELTVIVSAFRGRRVYVGGEVSKPGVVMMEGRLTVLGAIMEAGGFLKQSARMSNVIVVRERDGKQHATSVNLNKALQRRESGPFYLEPYDIVYVPRTRIDRVDQWVDQHINQIVPQNVIFTFDKSLDSQETQTGRTVQFQLPTP